VIRHTAIKSDPPPHFSQRRCSIADAKRFPGQRGRQDVGPCKNASTNDEVSRRVQLEQKKLAGAQGLKIGSASRLPEVDLIDAGKRR
jgi:hypothetical protein